MNPSAVKRRVCACLFVFLAGPGSNGFLRILSRVSCSPSCFPRVMASNGNLTHCDKWLLLCPGALASMDAAGRRKGAIMKWMKTALALSVVLLSATMSAPALAHHRGHFHFGVVVGGPFYPWWYHPYYYPPVVTVPAAPTTYVEQGAPEAAPAAQPQGYWYYCDESKTYYPYVKECAGGWRRVTPQPAR